MKRLVTALILLVGVAGAETLSVSLGKIACIQKDGYARLLAKFDLSAIPESSHIYYAQVVAPCNIAETVAIETRRITTLWSRENVRWDYPWRKRGGDFDTTRSAMFAYIAGRHDRLAIDITHYVREWQRARHSSNFGLLFRKGITREPGFNRHQGLSGALAKARVRVIYRKPDKHDASETGKPSSD